MMIIFCVRTTDGSYGPFGSFDDALKFAEQHGDPAPVITTFSDTWPSPEEGDLDEWEIKKRLIENIHRQTNYAYAESGVMPVWVAANLIQGVWEYMDRMYMDQLARGGDDIMPEDPQ